MQRQMWNRQLFTLVTKQLKSLGDAETQKLAQNVQIFSRCISSIRGPESDGSHKSFPESTKITAQPPTGSREISSVTIEGLDKLNDLTDSASLQNEQFDDLDLAYSSKTTGELAIMSLFYFLFQFQTFTDNCSNILKAMNKILGKRLSHFVIRRLFYKQYVAGETTEEVEQVIRRLQKGGIDPLIAVPMESDLSDPTIDSAAQVKIMEHNCETMLNCIDLATTVSGHDPMIQLRITGLITPSLNKILSLAIGDNTTLSTDVVQILVDGMQGKELDIPNTKQWEDVAAHVDELKLVLKRLKVISEKALKTNTVIMVDAEYTYFNPSIRHLTYAMKEICNKQKPLVFYTYQAYLKSTYEILKSDLSAAKSLDVCFGAKMVRGAYIVKERYLAKTEGYPDPVNDTYEDTTQCYQNCLEELLSAAKENEDRIRFIIASHNEDSIRYTFKKMASLGLPCNSKSVLFGQLYGMADHVSFTLGKKGCNVVKSLPYGSVDDTIPYLSRRAQENRSIFDNVRKERDLVKKALYQRMSLKQ